MKDEHVVRTAVTPRNVAHSVAFQIKAKLGSSSVGVDRAGREQTLIVEGSLLIIVQEDSKPVSPHIYIPSRWLLKLEMAMKKCL